MPSGNVVVIQVDPAGLASTAQRIADVLAELMGGDPVHPPLGADPASAGAAARLSTAGASLVAVIGQQALGLAVTAAQLLNVSTTFEVQDLLNKSGLDKLGIPDLITVTGWAPPSPPIPPTSGRRSCRRRCPAEALSTAVHSGDPNGGAAFISAWRVLVSELEGAADTVRAAAAQLPEQWDSPVSTDAVRDHLYRYAQAFDTSASRATTPGVAGRPPRRAECDRAQRHSDSKAVRRAARADPDGVGGQHRLRRPLRRPAHPAAGDDRAGFQDDAGLRRAAHRNRDHHRWRRRRHRRGGGHGLGAGRSGAR